MLADYNDPKNWEKLEIGTACIYERQRLISYKPNPVADFLFFYQREVNPLLSAALCRNEFHPTFMRLLFWMLYDRIAGYKL